MSSEQLRTELLDRFASLTGQRAVSARPYYTQRPPPGG